ncbi:MAG TPA: Rne/Rng family ribonuclease [Candidatus Babeliales bacterium]|nr:Rne/Rng family ribonuclease [Candidatus Babeliales bacterium]
MKRILISENPWQARAAITDNDRLQNVYFEPRTTEQLERSFFKGVITKVLPGIQTAFVDIGKEKAGFLHISEIDRELAITRMGDSIAIDDDAEEEKKPVRRRPADIAKILKEGEPIIVQVSKEPVYEKGAKLTTCFTIPGRFIVLMPNIPRIGISKKIEDRNERQRLKELLRNNLPEGMGCIIRTSSENKSDKEIISDLNFLVHTWNKILQKYAKAEPKAKIYTDVGLPLQVVRDYLDDDVESIVVNNKETQYQIYELVKEIAPEYTHKIKFYSEPPALFDKYGIEKQIYEALQKKTQLQSGGSIIIETTEAMTVIDVNTGKFTGSSNLEDTILQTNLEAAQEIVRQLRLRNIGGLIVIDFIDMSSNANRQKLYRHLEQRLKEYDKFQSVVLKVSEFGLVQMTRKRSGKTLQQQLTQTCSCCKGLGVVKSIRTQCYGILRQVKIDLEEQNKSVYTLYINTTLFDFLNHTEYNSILDLEKSNNCSLTLAANNKLAPNEYRLES